MNNFAINKLAFATILMSLCVLSVIFALPQRDAVGRDYGFNIQVSPTSIRVVIPTVTPIATEGELFTATPTFTPTPEGPLQLQVIGDTPVNVRAQADINSEQLGTIRPEETYTVIGRLFLWYQIVFESSPSGRGWVFADLVEVLGDESEVADLSIATQPPVNNSTVAEGSILGEESNQTATANSRIIDPPIASSANDGSGVQAGGALPTFTYPANVPALAPTLGAELNEATLLPEATTVQLTRSSGGIAPILPIIILGSVGLLGLLISSIRR